MTQVHKNQFTILTDECNNGKAMNFQAWYCPFFKRALYWAIWALNKAYRVLDFALGVDVTLTLKQTINGKNA